MRLLECCRLRVKDVDFGRNQITVRRGKGDKDRVTMLPGAIVDYLLTWNCKHIANATMRQAIERVCREAGYEPPVICTPEELMNDESS